MRRRIRRHPRTRILAISLLILSLFPTPWPKVEFHNVRHHDEPGQLCEYHDHLLRWHPDATSAEDVAVLHWHWAWPSREAPDSGHDGDGPRLHAHLADDALPAADSGPVIVADISGRLVPIPLAASPPLPAYLPVFLPRAGLASSPGMPSALPFSATFAPRTSLTSRLHRWSC